MAKATKTTKGKKSEAVSEADVIKQVAEELLGQIGIEATVGVSETEDEGGEKPGTIYQVSIETAESGLLIGYHGETLSSLQLIIGLIAFRKLGQWVRVVVNVGDYRQKREEQLAGMANAWAAQAVSSGQLVYAPFLPPGERRIIHLALQGRDDVETYSEGEGRNRRLVIKPKLS